LLISKIYDIDKIVNKNDYANIYYLLDISNYEIKDNIFKAVLLNSKQEILIEQISKEADKIKFENWNEKSKTKRVQLGNFHAVTNKEYNNLYHKTWLNFQKIG
jgi:hypothetical protein